MIISEMKKAIATISSLGFLTTVSSVFAQVNVAVTPPTGVTSNTNVSVIIKNALIIVFTAATLLVLIYLIIGAFQWITSGGDKEAVGKARGKITNALIGLLILALSFVIVNVVTTILGLPGISSLTLPKLFE
jgi:hypothetical protein